MVKTLKEKDIPEPWFGKNSKPVTITPKRTRAASKLMEQQHVVEDDAVDEPSPKGEAREKGAGRDDVVGKGRKKVKAVRPGTTDVVLGRSKYAVPDHEEMRRKRIADANACGRVVKCVSQAATRKSCPTTAPAGTSSERSHPELVTGGVDNVNARSRSPIPGIAPADEGMDTHSQECENTNGIDVRVTPSGVGTGQEHYREDREHAKECLHGGQERGKRKVVEIEIVNSTSSERSDENAQKYRRLEMSPSPIIVKERVSCITWCHEC